MSATVAPERRELLCCFGRCHCDGKLTVSHPCIHAMGWREYAVLGAIIQDYYNRARYGAGTWTKITDMRGLGLGQGISIRKILHGLVDGGYLQESQSGDRGLRYRPTQAGRDAWWANTPGVQRGIIGAITGGNE